MIRRHLLGVFALLLLAVGVWYLWQGTQTSTQEIVLSSCLRIGSVLAVIWLAWPDLARLPPFLCIAGGFLLLVMIRWPRLALYLLPVILLMWLLRPRRGGSARPLTTRGTKSARADLAAREGDSGEQCER